MQGKQLASSQSQLRVVTTKLLYFICGTRSLRHFVLHFERLPSAAFAVIAAVICAGKRLVASEVQVQNYCSR